MHVSIASEGFLSATSRFVRLFAVGMGLWTFCTGLSPGDVWPGVISATLFAYTGFLVLPAHPRLRFRALPGFFIYFVIQSIRSGAHVASVALRPGLQLNPGWVAWSTQLPEGPPQAVFANTVGLLPGTLCAEVEDGIHTIHLLHQGGDPPAELRRLERQIARLFGLKIDPLTAS